MLRRWMWLVLSSALTACAAVPLAPSEEVEESGGAVSFEQLCAEEDSLVALCGAQQCGMYRCREVMEELTAGRVVLARTGGAVLPGLGSSAQRYWGSVDGLPKTSKPVFTIPWDAKLPLLPSQTKMVEALEAEWRRPHEKHHIFPQEPRLKKGGAWNEAWRKYRQAHRNATKEEILRYAGQLIYEFELLGPVVPYYRQWTQPPPIGGW